jgi:hypothetical protein
LGKNASAADQAASKKRRGVETGSPNTIKIDRTALQSVNQWAECRHSGFTGRSGLRRSLSSGRALRGPVGPILPAGQSTLGAARVAAPNVTGGSPIRKRVLNPGKNNPRDSAGRIAGCFRRYGPNVQNLRRAIGQCAHCSVTDGVCREFDAGLHMAVGWLATCPT